MKALIMAITRSKWDEVTTWIEELDGEVVTAVSTKHALRLLNSDHDIDLILTESGRSNEFASALLQAVKNDLRLSTLPLIMVDTKFDHESIRDFLAKGVNDIIALPISREAFEAKIRSALSKGRKRILLVDDEPVIRDLLSQFLVLERYIPLEAGTAEEALEIIDREPLDAVVTDIKLPGMSGTELLAKIKERNLNLPVILITGLTGLYGPEKALSMGADGFFAKPFHNMDLLYTLRRVLSRSRTQSRHAAR